MPRSLRQLAYCLGQHLHEVAQFKREPQAGQPRVRFHDLRHSCATLLLVQGVSPRVVMEVLGHSEIALTMNAYSRVVPELQQDAAQRL